MVCDAAEDVARVIVSILENPSAHKGKTYQLFGPKEYTYRAIELSLLLSMHLL
jgi:uncharacterized protein YbjT (DUF2867 family)